MLLLLCLLTGSSITAQWPVSPNPPGQPPPWDRLRPTFYDKALTESQKKILYPSPEDEAAYSAFLSAGNSGMFRLLPKGKYEFSSTVAADRDPNTILPVLGGGAYYSFTQRTNKYGPWSDIRLENNRLFVGITNKAIRIITALGDVRLESVTTDTPGLRFLVGLVPPKTYSGMAELHRIVAQGVESSGFVYASVTDAVPNTTYALRSISYQKDGYLVYPNEPYTRLRFARIGYDGSDVVVAFRVLRRNEDGSLDILWKRIQKSQNPKIKGDPPRLSFNSVKQLMEREIHRDFTATEVIEFLDLNGIEHSDYVGAYKDENAPMGADGLVSATIPGIERRVRAIFDLNIQFYFTDQRKLIDYGLKKERK
jgi:hypothetical protein